MAFLLNPFYTTYNVLAQALWKVRATRSEVELDKFVSRLRVYTISDQDDSAPWIRKTFPDLFYIASPGFHAGGAYHFATWSGISGDYFHGRFTGADYSIVDNPWLNEHIRCKGPLGAQYPQSKFLMEGDTPTFLYLINNGLGNPEHPNWGSWGGVTNFIHRLLKKALSSRRLGLSGVMQRMRFLALMATGTLVIKPLFGDGVLLFKTIFQLAWTGPLNPMMRQIIRLFLSSLTQLN